MAGEQRVNIAGKTLVVVGQSVFFPEQERLRQLVEGCGGKLDKVVTEAADLLVCNGSLPEELAGCGLPVITEAALLAALWPDEPPAKKQFTGTIVKENMGTFKVKKGVLVGFTGEGRFVLIPPEVTEIGERAFAGCAGVQMVTIPEGVCAIRSDAFFMCENLVDVSIAFSVRHIGERAFYGCDRLRRILIPRGVETIGERAFYQLRSLREVTVGSTVRSIGRRAFCACRCLEKLTLEDGVEEIGIEAFAENVGLHQLQLPGSVRLEEKAFAHCTHLEKLQIQPGLKEISHRCFEAAEALEQLQLPEGLERIGECAFAYCARLMQVLLPESLRRIGAMAFAGCQMLDEIRIPGGVEVIPEDAFSYCELRKLTLSEGLRAIEAGAFYGCSFRSLVLPRSLEIIRENAFHNCVYLESVEGPEYIPQASVRAFYGCRRLADSNGLLIVENTLVTAFLRGVTELVIPDGVTAIGDDALLETEDLETVVVPDSVTSFGRDFLAGADEDESAYESLRSVTLPAHVTEIGERVLRPDCFLEYLYAPGLSVSDLKDRHLMPAATAGYLCHPEDYQDPLRVAVYQKFASSHKKQIVQALLMEDRVEGLSTYGVLGKITPGNLEKDFLQPALEANAIGCIAFLMDWKNKNVDPEDEEKRLMRELNRDIFHAQDMKKLWKSVTVDGGCRLVRYLGEEKEVTVPPRIGRKPVLQLAPFAMSPQDGTGTTIRNLSGEQITAVTFLAGIPLIGTGAFRNCRRLERVSFAPGTQVLEDMVFFGCGRLQQVELAPGLLEIGSKTFEGCMALRELTLPDTLQRLGDGVFSWCRGLRSVTLSPRLKELPRELFSACRSLREISIPEGVVTVGEAAFRWCQELTRVQLPQSLVRIDDAAFHGCTRLQQLELPEGVTTVGSDAFAECYQLSRIRLPGSLQSLGSDVFRDCVCLTIQAPAGSFAQTYAKQQKIPFVAE